MLYIVGTPIGNLEDISLRALRILGEVDFILCEDTRVTKKLLDHYKINTRTISCHQHSDDNKINYILELLDDGKDLALVSDAGTPGISDPGGKLVQAIIDKFGDDMKIESVPGPSAVTAALSISGIPTDKFIFMGFPPHKKGRQTFLKKIINSEFPVVVYESKHRIIKFLMELSEMVKGSNSDEEKNSGEEISNFPVSPARLARLDSARLASERAGRQSPIFPGLDKRSGAGKHLPAGRQEFKIQNSKRNKKLTSVIVCRELSKMHETIYRGELEKTIEKIKSDKNDQKGEFVVIIGK